MTKREIKSKVNQLKRKACSSDPFDIAAALNIKVIYEPLGNVDGYYNKTLRMKQIHINEDLSPLMQMFTCAHELGHALLHPNVSTPFLRRNTLFSVDRLEQEANKFAVELMIPDEILAEYADLTLDQMANMYGFDRRLIQLRLE